LRSLWNFTIYFLYTIFRISCSSVEHCLANTPLVRNSSSYVNITYNLNNVICLYVPWWFTNSICNVTDCGYKILGCGRRYPMWCDTKKILRQTILVSRICVLHNMGWINVRVLLESCLIWLFKSVILYWLINSDASLHLNSVILFQTAGRECWNSAGNNFFLVFIFHLFSSLLLHFSYFYLVSSCLR
jgi:hypothetical protein